MTMPQTPREIAEKELENSGVTYASYSVPVITETIEPTKVAMKTIRVDCCTEHGTHFDTADGECPLCFYYGALGRHVSRIITQAERRAEECTHQRVLSLIETLFPMS